MSNTRTNSDLSGAFEFQTLLELLGMLTVFSWIYVLCDTAYIGTLWNRFLCHIPVISTEQAVRKMKHDEHARVHFTVKLSEASRLQHIVFPPCNDQS